MQDNLIPFKYVEYDFSIAQDIASYCATPLNKYLKTPSGKPYDRVQTVKEVTDFLYQERYVELKEFIKKTHSSIVPNLTYRKNHSEKTEKLLLSVQEFSLQAEKIKTDFPVYTNDLCKSSSFKKYRFGKYKNAPLKVVTQKMYDYQVKNGFPKDFLSNSYFENVNFYALPPNADFENSSLEKCNFNLVNAANCDFSKSYLIDVAFRNTNLYSAKFVNADLYNVQFSYCNLTSSNFSMSNFRGGHIRKSDMSNAHVLSCKLNGTWFGDIKTDKGSVTGLENISFTVDGATGNEIKKMQDTMILCIAN